MSTAGRGARADHRMDLVDEEDRVGVVLEFVDDRLQPLLEIAPVTGARKQRAHVEREDGGALQNLPGLARDDLARKALGDRGLADAGVADEQRVVLAPAAEHLHAAFHLVLAPDQRVDIALPRPRIEIDAILAEGGFLAVFLGSLALVLEFVGALHRPRFPEGRVLGDAVGDEVDRVVAGHVLLLQEIGRVRFALGENRHENIRSRNLRPTGNSGHGSPRAGSRAGRPLVGTASEPSTFVTRVDKLVVDEGVQCLAEFVDVHRTGLHHLRRVGFVDQGEQQVLERGQFVPALIGQRQSSVDCLFESVRKKTALPCSSGHGPGRLRAPANRGLVYLKFGGSSPSFKVFFWPAPITIGTG